MTQLPREIPFQAARDGVLDTIVPADVETIEQVEEVFNFLEESGLPTPRAAMRTLRSSGEPPQALSPGVHLLNAHTGKGQQFDWTFVVGPEEKHIPDKRSSRGPALAEEMRVLLVMLSRARHGLVVTWVAKREEMYGAYRAVQSRWFAPIDAVKPNSWTALTAHIDKASPRTGAETRAPGTRPSSPRVILRAASALRAGRSTGGGIWQVEVLAPAEGESSVLDGLNVQIGGYRVCCGNE